MNIIISDTYQYLKDWISTIPLIFSSSGKIIYNARNQIRVIEGPDGIMYNIKRYHQPLLCNRIFYTFIRQPKAYRAYHNALFLLSKGIPTPTPIAYILCGNFLLQESYLITLQEPLKHTFYEFRNHSVRGYEQVIHDFALLTANMHQNKIMHLDYSPGNIIFDIDQEGNVHLSLVDINRLQFGKNISQKQACKNFCRLWGHKDFLLLLAKEYAHCRGWNEQITQDLILTYWKLFWHVRNDDEIEQVMCPIDLT